MDLELTQAEVRVLGSLVEKEAATPDYYPLSLNALVNACNQKSNREPVMAVEEGEVAAAVESLQTKGLALKTTGADHRVPKYSHRLGEVFNFDRREQVVLCVLMLRGPQTLGELRGRTERLHPFDSLEAVEGALARLAERTPALVRKLARQPGEKEPRYAHLLASEVAAPEPSPMAADSRASLEERVSRLEAEVAELRRGLEEFRKSFE
jgi:uncharacterized protein YceH (UPF0502 family)